MSYAQRTSGLLFAAALVFSACSDASSTAPGGPATPPPRVATTITIADPGALTDGDVRPLQATVADQFGVPMSGVTVQWQATDPTIVTVSDAGVLTAHAEGTTRVTASAAGTAGTRTLTVTRHPAARVELGSPLLELAAGSTRQLVATVRGLDGRALPGRDLSWTSNDPAVARVSASGLVTAIAPGQAVIAVRHGTVMAEARVTVAGVATNYQVTTLDGRALPLVIEQWDETDANGFTYQMIERLERGIAQFDGRYDVELVVGVYRRQSVQGNVIEQRLRQRVVRDRGTLEYHWLDGSAQLRSELIGGLTHVLQPDGTHFRLGFRLGGTNTIWALSLRQRQ